MEPTQVSAQGHMPSELNTGVTVTYRYDGSPVVILLFKKEAVACVRCW